MTVTLLPSHTAGPVVALFFPMIPFSALPLADDILPLTDDLLLQEEIDQLQTTNRRLLAENAALRQELKQAQKLIAQLKSLLRRHL
jgi:hypothetical protein